MCCRVAIVLAFAAAAIARSACIGSRCSAATQDEDNVIMLQKALKTDADPDDKKTDDKKTDDKKTDDKKTDGKNVVGDAVAKHLGGKFEDAVSGHFGLNVPEEDGTEINISPKSPAVNMTAAFAEYVAMTLFVIIGCGSAMAVAKEDGWILQVALTFGLAISSLAYAVGHYSGGQINCAVTFGLVLAGQLSFNQGMANFVCQMLGSISGAYILTFIIPEEKDKTGGLATNKVAEGWSQNNAFLGEAAMTFLLMFVVLETAVNPESKANREMAALAIGFAVFLAHSVLISIDGCSINPTRTFGPAYVRSKLYKNAGEGPYDEMFVFWGGPLTGALAATIASTWLMR